MNEDEKWTAYNVAGQALDILISRFSACMYAERKGANPDHEEVGKWRAERAELMQLRRALTVKDMATIVRVNDEYGPKAKAIMGKE